MKQNRSNRTESGLNPSDFESMVDGKAVELFVLSNRFGAEATVINYGAIVVSLMVPDRDGKLVDVVLGHDSIAEYLKSEEPYFGAICGRTGNRIAGARFTLDGVEYRLTANKGTNNLHGGVKGFNAVVWDARQVDSQTIELTYLSEDRQEGYPGNLTTVVTYRLTDDNALEITYRATTDKSTIVNLTNHSYFNLSGAGDPYVGDHMLQIYADQYLPTDEAAIPLGAPAPVAGTPMDFVRAQEIGAHIDDDFEQLRIGKGYDHTYVLNKKEGDLALVCYSPKSGIVMETYTTQPGVQMYTSNWLTGSFVAKNGNRYPIRSAVCFETQHYPDSINHPDYPSIVLRPGEVFGSMTSYKFSVKNN